MKKNNKGFTLVELLVVIAIIGILAVVAVPALFKNIEKGKIADLEGDISAIRSAALSYYADTSTMPVQDDILTGKEKICAEIEGLSNPFKATSYATSIVDNNLILTISTSNTISTSGLNKLKQDLGNKYDDTSNGTTIKVKLMSK